MSCTIPLAAVQAWFCCCWDIVGLVRLVAWYMASPYTCLPQTLWKSGGCLQDSDVLCAGTCCYASLGYEIFSVEVWSSGWWWLAFSRVCGSTVVPKTTGRQTRSVLVSWRLHHRILLILTEWLCFRHVTIIDVVAICGLVSALLSQLILAYPNSSSTLHVTVLAVMMLTGLVMTLLLLIEYQSLLLYWEWQQLVADFKALLANMKSCFEVYVKCIKLVEEQNLITNGYSR